MDNIIQVILDSYIYRFDIHKLQGKYSNMSDFILKNNSAIYFITRLFENVKFNVIIKEMSDMYFVEESIILDDMENFITTLLPTFDKKIELNKKHKGIPLDIDYNLLEYPMSVEIELTKRCNWKCRFCYNVWKYNKIESTSVDLSLENFKSIIDESISNGCNNIRLSGGEPTLHPHFTEFLKYANSKGVKISLFTNATLVDEEMVVLLKNSNVENVLISLHGLEEQHEEFTGIKGSYNDTLNKISLLINNGINVSIETILSGKLDKELLFKMADTLYSIGVKNWNFMPYVETGSFQDDEYKFDFCKANSLIREIIEKYDINIRVVCSQKLCLDKYMLNEDEFIKNYYIDGNCGSGIFWISISYDGKIRNCPHSNMYAGVISEGIKNVYLNKLKPTIMSIYDFQEDKCSDCIAYSSCRGGCHLNRIEGYRYGI